MDRIETNPAGDQRDRVLAVLREHANPRGYVTGDITLIARQTGISSHDVVKQLWGLQKQRIVGFSTKTIHGRGLPYRFRLLKGAPEPTNGISEATDTDAGAVAPADLNGAEKNPAWAAGFKQKDEYPEITAVLSKALSIQLAEEGIGKLRAARMDDVADMAQESMPELSPLESEIILLMSKWGREHADAED